MIRSRREPSLKARLAAFDYQDVAVERLAEAPFGAVFHEQGLGKTKIALDIALRWLSKGDVDSVLICCKRNLIDNWREEIRAHTFIEPRLLSQHKGANFEAFNSPARVYLTHYEVLVSERSRFRLFLKTRRVGVILDEAHKIKNPAATVTRTLFELRDGFTRRIILTGTPIANRPYDIWSQIYFLDGGETLGPNYATFKKQFDLSNKLLSDKTRRQSFEEAVTHLAARLEPFVVRETKESTGIDLPTKSINDVRVDLEHRQRELYDSYRNDLRSIIVRDGKPSLDEADEILKRLLRLVQIASNPILIDETYIGPPGKYDTLERIVRDAVVEGDKIIVWTSFIKNADWLARELRPFGATKLHGQLNYDDRRQGIKAFKTDPECRVLVATLGAAKEGLTLTSANRAVFFDRTFSLDDYLQAQDRIHRISQTKECVITNIIATDTVDEWVDALINAKAIAARMAQGDISESQFYSEMSYGFSEILQSILGK